MTTKENAGTLHYQRLIATPGVREAIDMSGNMPDEKMQASIIGQNAMMFHTLNRFEACGRQIIKLGPVMTETFEDMSASNILPDMVRAPYPVFYVHLPHTSMHVVRLKDDVRLPLEGVYVLDAGDEWYLALIGYHEERDTLIIYRWPHAQWLASGKEFEIFVREHFGLFNPRDEEQPIYAMTMIIHTCLYLVSQDRDVEVKEARKYNKLKTKWEKSSENRRKSIEEQMLRVNPFRTTTLAPRAEQLVSALSEEDRQYRQAHMVRGHWKRQRHGKNLEEVKVLYIQPYLRGDGERDERIRLTTTA